MKVMFFKSKAPQIHRVTGVSYPRSGHHLLERLLGLYFGRDFVYCPSYTREKFEREGRIKEKMPHAWSYNCSLGQECPNLGHVHFCKNHEWDGRLVPKVAGRRYLVQYRDFLPAVVSSFEQTLLNNNASQKKDPEKKFRIFARRKAQEYREFTQRWVAPQDDGIVKLVVRYEDMTAAPEETLEKVLCFFGQEGKIDRARMRDALARVPKNTIVDAKRVIVENSGVAPGRVLEDFRYYSPELFDELDRLSKAAA